MTPDTIAGEDVTKVASKGMVPTGTKPVEVQLSYADQISCAKGCSPHCSVCPTESAKINAEALVHAFPSIRQPA